MSQDLESLVISDEEVQELHTLSEALRLAVAAETHARSIGKGIHDAVTAAVTTVTLCNGASVEKAQAQAAVTRLTNEFNAAHVHWQQCRDASAAAREAMKAFIGGEAHARVKQQRLDDEEEAVQATQLLLDKEGGALRVNQEKLEALQATQLLLDQEGGALRVNQEKLDLEEISLVVQILLALWTHETEG